MTKLALKVVTDGDSRSMGGGGDERWRSPESGAEKVEPQNGRKIWRKGRSV